MAEVELAKATDKASGAKAAAALLAAEHAALQAPIRKAQIELRPLLYFAHKDHVGEVFSEFEEVANEFAKAHSRLQGASLAADQFASPQEGRPFNAAMVPLIVAVLPSTTI